MRQRLFPTMALTCAMAFAATPGAATQPLAQSGATASMQPAPEFAYITRWINSPPLTMQRLRGKVVLIDFWAYSCINCLRTLPHVNHWYDTYKDKGFVVVGVHTPEFAFEKEAANVEHAVTHFGIHYPVAMDNDNATWNAWRNQYWPQEYLVDRSGRIVATHIGEGNPVEMENAIRQQLGLAPLAKADETDPDLAKVGSPEMAFGSHFALRYFANRAENPDQINIYRAAATLPLNQYALQGRWRIERLFAVTSGSHNAIHLHFRSGKLYMVASSPQPVTLTITVDGKPQPPVTVQASKLYTLFDSNDYGDHQVEIGRAHV